MPAEILTLRRGINSAVQTQPALRDSLRGTL